jgi:hypothetical protein
MAQVLSVRPIGVWGLWCRPAAGVVAVGRNDYAVEVVGVVDERLGFVVVMEVVEVFGYAVVMVVVEGFGYEVELHALVLADRECRGCIAKCWDK